MALPATSTEVRAGALHRQLLDPVHRAAAAGAARRGARPPGSRPSSSGGPSPPPRRPTPRSTHFVRAIQDAGVQLTGLNFAAGDMPAGDRGLLSVRRGHRSSATASTSPSASASGWARAPSTPSTATAWTASTRATRTTSPRRTSPAPPPRLASAPPCCSNRVSGATAYPLQHRRRRHRRDRPGRKVGATTSRLLADLYHLTVNGDDVAAVIRDHAARIGHVQIADAPGRDEPGTGEIPLRRATSTQLDDGRLLRLRRPGVRPQTDHFDWPADRVAARHERNEISEHDRFHRARHHGRPDGRPPGRRRPRRHRLQPLAGPRGRAGRGAAAGPPTASPTRSRAADVVITMVPDSPDVEAVALGDDGVYAAAQPGTLHIDCSTIRPDVAAQLAAAGASAASGSSTPRSAAARPARRTPRCRSWSAAPEDVGRGPADPRRRRQDHRARRPHRRRPDRQGRQPADRRRQHRAARRGDRVPGGLRRRHRRRGRGARRRAGRQHGARPQGRRDAASATSPPASASPCTTRTWASSPPPPARPASRSRSARTSPS